MRFQGKLTNWDDAKGIGTITWNGSHDKVFVHISAFTTRRKRPVAGDIVTYEVEKDKQGKFRAVNVAYPQSQFTPESKRSIFSNGGFVGFVLAAFLLYLLFTVFTGKGQPFVLIIYLVASVISFIVYWHDKSAAKQGQQRTPESNLHMCALGCGWPGAYLAQRIFHHKSTKASFQRVFVATVLINVVGFYIYASPSASDVLLKFLGLLHG